MKMQYRFLHNYIINVGYYSSSLPTRFDTATPNVFSYLYTGEASPGLFQIKSVPSSSLFEKEKRKRRNIASKCGEEKSHRPIYNGTRPENIRSNLLGDLIRKLRFPCRISFCFFFVFFKIFYLMFVMFCW